MARTFTREEFYELVWSKPMAVYDYASDAPIEGWIYRTNLHREPR